MVIAAVLGSACDGGLCSEDRLPTCDIREEACQQTVQEAVRCMRGAASTEIPPIRVISVAELEAYLREGADPMMMRSLAWEGALKMLRLLDPGADFFEESTAGAVASILAFYTSVDDEVYVVDRGVPMDSADAVTTLAHELVHAAQDEEHDLEAMLTEARTHEEVMRTRTLVEGEATFYTFEAYAWTEGYGPEALDWSRGFEALMDDVEADLDATTSPYFVVYGLLTYAFGGRWQAGRWVMGGDDAVRAGLGDPPPSSAWLMMDPWGASEPPPPRAEALCEPPPPPDGFSLTSSDEMGAPLLYAFLHRWGMTHAEARSFALRWARDDLYVYGAPDGRVALAWRIVLADGSTARWIAQQIELETDLFRTGYVESTVVLLTASDPSVTEELTWDAAPECAPPP